MGCPPIGQLQAWLDLGLEPAAEAATAAHLDACRDCSRQLERLEPARLLARVRPRTLPPAAWDGVLREVWAEVDRSPRPGRGTSDRAGLPGWPAWLDGPGWPGWAGLGRAAALGAAFALAVLLLPGVVPGPLEGPPALADNLEGAKGFVYLSNPQAEVAHIVLPARGQQAELTVTMVVDESLRDAF